MKGGVKHGWGGIFRLRRANKNNASALPGGVFIAGPAARLFFKTIFLPSGGGYWCWACGPAVSAARPQ